MQFSLLQHNYVIKAVNLKLNQELDKLFELFNSQKLSSYLKSFEILTPTLVNWKVVCSKKSSCQILKRSLNSAIFSCDKINTEGVSFIGYFIKKRKQFQLWYLYVRLRVLCTNEKLPLFYIVATNCCLFFLRKAAHLFETITISLLLNCTGRCYQVMIIRCNKTCMIE